MLKTHLAKITGFIQTHKLPSALFLLALSLWTSVILFGQKFYADESYHYKQITRFHDLNFELVGMLTTIPGYHALMALFSSVLGKPSFMKIRFLTFVISLISIPLFYLLAKKIHQDKKTALTRTLQFMFFPISFIYYPLVYTDTFSTLLVLAALFFIEKKRYYVAGLLSIFSIAVRQNNFVWHIFLWAYSFVSLHGFAYSKEIIVSHLRKTILFPLGIAAFGIFVRLNGGIAFGDKTSHQAGLYLGNIYFFLAMASVLFLPLLLSELRKKTILTKKFGLGLALGMMTAASFFFFPPKLHGYNLSPGFLHDVILSLAYQKYALVYAFAIFAGFMTLYTMELKKYAYFIYPFAVLCLLPSWLVEQRYLILSFILLLVFRQEKSRRIEWTFITYSVLLCLALFYMVIATKFFF